MPEVRDSYISCGVKELRNISPRPLENLRAIAQYGKNNTNYFAFVQWSDVVKHRYHFGIRGLELEYVSEGAKFAEFITKTFPGTLTYTDALKNPNTGYIIRVWTWAVPRAQLKAFAKKRWPKMKISMPPLNRRHDYEY